jgi:hypothetical protein
MMPPMPRKEYQDRQARLLDLTRQIAGTIAEMAAQPADAETAHLVAFDKAEHEALMKPYRLKQAIDEIKWSQPEMESARHSIFVIDSLIHSSGFGPWVHFMDAKEGDECVAVEARVRGLFDRYAWTEATNERYRELLGGLDQFALTLEYHGPGAQDAADRPLSLVLYAGKPLKAQWPPNWTAVNFTTDQAAGLAARLAEEGLLDGLKAVKPNLAKPAGPEYSLLLASGQRRWVGSLGWGKMLEESLNHMGLGSSPDREDDAARAMDRLLDRLRKSEHK